MFKISYLFKNESYKKGLFLSTVLNIFTKAIMFLFNLLVAYYFGASGTTDLLFYSISISVFVASLLTTLNSTIIIPESMRLREQRSKDDFQSFLITFLFLYILISLLLAITIFLKPVYFYSLISKFSLDLLKNNTILIRMAVLLIPFLTLNALLIDILSACKLFSVSIIISCFNAIVSILLVYVIHDRLGVYSVLLSLLFSNIVQGVVLFLFLKSHMQWKIKPDFTLIHKKLLCNIINAQFGNFFSIFASYYPIYLLSKYENGILTSLNYGQKIIDIITLFLIVQFSSIIGIKLNETYAQKKNNEIEHIFSRSTSLLLFCTVPVCFFIVLFSTEICLLLFKHGNFTMESANNAGLFLKFLIISLPLIGLNSLIARLFMAAQKINISVYFQIGISIFTVIVIHLCVSKFGPIGYPYGLFVSYLVNIISVTLMIKSFIKEVNYINILITFGFIISLNLPIFSLLVIFKSLFSPLYLYITLITGGFFYLIALLCLNYIFKLNNDIYIFTKDLFLFKYFKKS